MREMVGFGGKNANKSYQPGGKGGKGTEVKVDEAKLQESMKGSTPPTTQQAPPP